MHAGGGFAFGEALVTHVALPNNPAFFGILGDIVGTLEDAIGTTDALVIEMADDAGVGVLFISTDRAAVHAAGVLTVVAGSGDGLLPAGGFVTA